MTPPPTSLKSHLTSILFWPAALPPIQHHHQYQLPTFSKFSTTIAQTAQAPRAGAGRGAGTSTNPSTSTGKGNGTGNGSRPGPEPDFPKASFKDLGANRTVKVVVYSSLAVIGSVETYGWYRWLKGKYWTPTSEDEARSET